MFDVVQSKDKWQTRLNQKRKLKHRIEIKWKKQCLSRGESDKREREREGERAQTKGRERERVQTRERSQTKVKGEKERERERERAQTREREKPTERDGAQMKEGSQALTGGLRWEWMRPTHGKLPLPPSMEHRQVHASPLHNWLAFNLLKDAPDSDHLKGNACVSNDATLKGRRTSFFNYQRSGLASSEIVECYDLLQGNQQNKMKKANRPHLRKFLHGELDRSCSGVGLDDRVSASAVPLS